MITLSALRTMLAKIAAQGDATLAVIGLAPYIHLHGGVSAPAPADATYLVTTADATLSAEIVVGATPGGELGGTWAAPTVDATHAGGTHAPTTADYLVGTAQAGLSAEIVVGATPGGELGGTWAAPTVDATHAGSTHPPTDADYLVGTAHAGLSAEIVVGTAPGGELGGTWAAPTVDATHAGGTHAPTDADYLVGTAQGGLSAEIVVGTAPGGELGGTWAAPTVDATHSGSAHHDAVTLAADADTLLGLTGQQVTLDTQTANTVFAGPAAGGAVDPTFRVLVDADIPAAIARDAEVTTAVSDHAAAADPHTGYVQESDASWVDLTDGGATTLHSHTAGAAKESHIPLMELVTEVTF